ncbi:hypothetical protein AALO_G00251800, partial [Alosa alosa]
VRGRLPPTGGNGGLQPAGRRRPALHRLQLEGDRVERVSSGRPPQPTRPSSWQPDRPVRRRSPEQGGV